MTEVDFYITPDAASQARERLACRIVSKAYQSGNSVYIHAEDERQAQFIDDQLWIFQAGSFIPHERYTVNTAHQAPILIGLDEEPAVTCDVMINLCHQVPMFFSRFLRVAELVDKNDTRRAQARERFRFYRERGYPLRSHELSQ